MMSVMPGIGRGTKDESTMATRKRPKMPRLRRRWTSGECRGWGAKSARTLCEMGEATTAFEAVEVMPVMTLEDAAKSRSCKKKALFVEEL
jgi:hypothetical protein